MTRRLRVLITGDAGFIGSHLFRTLQRADHEVTGWDLKRGVDLTDPALSIPDRFDRVYHLAAITDALSTDVTAIMRVNVMGTARLLNIFGDRLVFASSSLVNFPYNPYAISKRTGEELCRLYNAAIVRLPNVFGPGGHSFMDRAEDDTVIRIRGNGAQLRTWARVDAAVLELIRAQPGETRVVPGYTCTIREIAERYRGRKTILYESGRDNDIEFAPQLPNNIGSLT